MGQKFPPVAPGAGPGSRVIPFFAFPPAVRRVIYTTNAIEKRQRSCARSSRRAGTSQRRRGEQADLAGAAQHHGRDEMQAVADALSSDGQHRDGVEYHRCRRS